MINVWKYKWFKVRKIIKKEGKKASKKERNSLASLFSFLLLNLDLLHFVGLLCIIDVVNTSFSQNDLDLLNVSLSFLLSWRFDQIFLLASSIRKRDQVDGHIKDRINARNSKPRSAFVESELINI